ncbi:hypothetical protein FH063_005641 [Azospirillum argentinense]|uniref:Uncharacterized protein n=1 Tax=Azospirillum argentinense TaxID=2970906 RepID=A0A5B0KSC0_9PROT|nr:hypothetical protein FH063_005641 [Azospirillum argentinense]
MSAFHRPVAVAMPPVPDVWGSLFGSIQMRKTENAALRKLIRAANNHPAHSPR